MVFRCDKVAQSKIAVRQCIGVIFYGLSGILTGLITRRLLCMCKQGVVRSITLGD